MNKDLRQEIENIFEKNDGAIDIVFPRAIYPIQYEKIVKQILSLVYSHLEKKMPKMKTNEWWMKELDVPCSDYSYGHEHGYSICLSEIKQILKEELLDPKK